jgi:acetyl-CoA acetyltransferase
MSIEREIAILGAGMHPWGKWGRNFVEYGVVAAQAALADASVEWRDVQFVSGADTVRNGYPGYVAGATFAQALGWNGAQVASSYAACASGATALAAARAQILGGFCDVALVIGADTTPKGFLAPNKGERGDDPDWLRFRLLGATNPTYFGLYARRRMELFGATRDDFAQVKVKNARHGLHNPYARYAKEVTVAGVLAAPLVADPLGLLDICDDLSTAMELDWYEQIGLCEPGDAEKLVRAGDTTIGGRIPVNPSGGLACFGEAVPAQAIAQVCELTWQLRGRAEGRQVDGARTGLSINQGLFGHGSAVIVTR